MNMNDDEVEEKALQLEALLAQPTIDLWKLRELALSEGGLLNDSIRRRAWPALCGLNEAAFDNNSASTPAVSEAAGNPRPAAASPIILRTRPRESDHSADATDPSRSHNARGDRDFQQVEMDVTRCTWHLLTGTQRIQRLQMEHKRNKRIARVIKKKQGRLASCIQRVLSADKHNNLRYYQGYHDVACIFLSTLRDAAPPQAWAMLEGNSNRVDGFDSSASLSLDLPSAVLLQVSQSHLIDCMQDTFQPLQTTLHLSIFPLLALFDNAVHDHLVGCDMAPFFALPWVLTWFSHEIRDTQLCKRLFDAFLCSHPTFPIYVCIAMILHPYNRQVILETPCDFSALHHALSSLPKNSSSVGWKYQPGAGYVSDDDTSTSNPSASDMDDEDSCSSAGHGSDGSAVRITNDDRDGELVLLQAGINLSEGGMVDTISLNSSSLSRGDETEMSSPVPFQELIDMAVHFMHRIPPRSLVDLAKRYHGKKAVEEMMKQDNEGCSSLSMQMLETPVAWTLSPRTASQWWLKEQVRKLRGLPPRPHHQHKSKSSLLGTNETDTKSASVRSDGTDCIATIPPSNYVSHLRRAQYQRQRLSFQSNMAFLASGMALSRKEQKRQARRERTGMILITVVVALVAWRVSAMAGVPPEPPMPGASDVHSFQEVLVDEKAPDIQAADPTLTCSSCPVESIDHTLPAETDLLIDSETVDGETDVVLNVEKGQVAEKEEEKEDTLHVVLEEEAEMAGSPGMETDEEPANDAVVNSKSDEDPAEDVVLSMEKLEETFTDADRSMESYEEPKEDEVLSTKRDEEPARNPLLTMDRDEEPATNAAESDDIKSEL